MEQSCVLYEVCYVTTEDAWEPTGSQYVSKAQAEEELRRLKTSFPTAFVARTVMTRCDSKSVRRQLKAV